MEFSIHIVFNYFKDVIPLFHSFCCFYWEVSYQSCCLFEANLWVSLLLLRVFSFSLLLSSFTMMHLGMVCFEFILFEVCRSFCTYELTSLVSFKKLSSSSSSSTVSSPVFLITHVRSWHGVPHITYDLLKIFLFFLCLDFILDTFYWPIFQFTNSLFHCV